MNQYTRHVSRCFYDLLAVAICVFHKEQTVNSFGWLLDFNVNLPLEDSGSTCSLRSFMFFLIQGPFNCSAGASKSIMVKRKLEGEGGASLARPIQVGSKQAKAGGSLESV